MSLNFRKSYLGQKLLNSEENKDDGEDKILIYGPEGSEELINGPENVKVV